MGPLVITPSFAKDFPRKCTSRAWSKVLGVRQQCFEHLRVDFVVSDAFDEGLLISGVKPHRNLLEVFIHGVFSQAVKKRLSFGATGNFILASLVRCPTDLPNIMS